MVGSQAQIFQEFLWDVHEPFFLQSIWVVPVKVNNKAAYMKRMAQRTHDNGKSNSSGNKYKSLTLFSQMRFVLCTECSMLQEDISNMVDFYNW